MQIPLILSLSLLTHCACAGEVQVEVLGCPPGKTVRIALYNHAQGFSDDRDGHAALLTLAVLTEDGTARARFRDLKAGRYAVSAFADVNANGRLDSNFIGMPSEPYGFSRDARKLLSAPGFDEAAFDLGGDSHITHTLHLQ